MNLVSKKIGGLHLLIAEGAIEESCLREIADLLNGLPLTAEKYVLLDCNFLKKLIYRNIGFSGFINYLLHFKKMHAGIILFGCDSQVHKLLTLLGLKDSFEYASTLDEAYLNLKSLSQAV